MGITLTFPCPIERIWVWWTVFFDNSSAVTLTSLVVSPHKRNTCILICPCILRNCDCVQRAEIWTFSMCGNRKTFRCCLSIFLMAEPHIRCLWSLCHVFQSSLNLWLWLFAWSLQILSSGSCEPAIRKQWGPRCFYSRDRETILMLKHYHLYRMQTMEKWLWRFCTCELIELPLQISFSTATPHFGHLRWNTLIGASDY